MCAGCPNMLKSVPLFVLALTTTLAAPSVLYDDIVALDTVPQKHVVPPRLLIAQNALREEDNQPIDRTGIADNVETVPQKRAALVLDRLLVALQKALREEGNQIQYELPDRDGPRVAPLRIADDNFNDMSSLERRGQTNSGRGRVLRCYFNAVTCF